MNKISQHFCSNVIIVTFLFKCGHGLVYPVAVERDIMLCVSRLSLGLSGPRLWLSHIHLGWSLPLSLILFLSIYLILQGTVIVGNEIHGLKVKHLHVGGVLGSGEVQSGIRGCIQVRPCHHGNSNCLLLCLLLWVFRVNNITEYHWE